MKWKNDIALFVKLKKLQCGINTQKNIIFATHVTNINEILMDMLEKMDFGILKRSILYPLIDLII